MYQEITKCRVCGGNEFIMSLGTQHFTGVFPKNKQDEVMKALLTWLNALFLVDADWS